MVNQPTDVWTRLIPGARIGERVSLRVTRSGASTEVIGFITALDDTTVTVVDRRGTHHPLSRTLVTGFRRVGVARGRAPASAPRALLDDLAARASAPGEPWVARLSDLLAQEEPPAEVPPWGTTTLIGRISVRVEGEWVTLAEGTPETWVAAGWWATRAGARSIQVRTRAPGIEMALSSCGFTPHQGA